MFFDNLYLNFGLWALLLTVLGLFKRRGSVHYHLKFLYFGIHSTFFTSIFIPVMLFRPRHYKNALMPAWGVRLMKIVFGLNWTVSGVQNIVQHSGAVVILNHQSVIDLIVLAELWPVMDRCTVISKKEILYAGPLGLASYLWGTIFIDRRNSEKAKDALNKTVDVIRTKGVKLCMFPEGTRCGGDDLSTFKKGPFHLALAAGVPIQPVVVSKYYYIDHQAKTFDAPGTTHIHILPPIPTDGLCDTKENVEIVLSRAFEVMSNKYRELNATLPR